MTLAEVRNLALALHGTTESPHFRYTSFRVRGRIYATAPRDDSELHVFVDEEDRDRMIVLHPGTYEKLGWGRKVVGLKVALGSAKAEDVQSLLQAAWLRKLGKK